METTAYEMLNQWSELLKNGTITENEFSEVKGRLLGNEKKQEKPVISTQSQSVKELPHKDNNKAKKFNLNILWMLLLGIALLVGIYFAFIYDNTAKQNNELETEFLFDEDYEQNIDVHEASLKLDPVIHNVNINGAFFTIKVFQEDDDEFGNANTTIHVVKKGADKPIYTKRFEDIHFYSFSKAKKALDKQGKLFFNVAYSGGTVHYGGDMYLISFINNKISLKKVMDISDTRFEYFNKNDKDILIIDYNWNNGYWEDDNYTLSLYTFDGNTYKKREIGTTLYKYGLESFSINEVYINEPELFDKIDIKEYLLQATARTSQVYFHSKPNVNYRLSSYFVKGQTAEILEDLNDFLKVEFEYKGNITVGYVLKKEVEVN